MIKGEKIGLRAIERADLSNLRDWRNIESFRKCFREVRELSLADQERWFEKSCTGNPNDFMFIIEDLKTGKAIGACGLLYTNWIIRSADFSFYIGDQEKYIGHDGIALDAAKVLVNYGFKQLNLNKVWMELYEYDEAKLSFFKKQLNFHQEGVLRDNCFHDGRYWNSEIISLLKCEWS